MDLESSLSPILVVMARCNRFPVRRAHLGVGSKALVLRVRRGSGTKGLGFTGVWCLEFRV